MSHGNAVDVRGLQNSIKALNERLEILENDNLVLRAHIISLQAQMNDLKAFKAEVTQARLESDSQKPESSEDEIEVIDFRHGVSVKLKNSDDTHGNSDEDEEMQT